MKCIKNTWSKNPEVVKTKTRKMIHFAKCAECESKKLKFINEQEASALIISLGIRRHLSKIPLVSPLLRQEYKMNEIMNKCLLEGDQFTAEMHLGQSGFI